MRKLYLFDFDGTLTYKDTMPAFLKFYNRKKYIIQFGKHLPLFVLLKLGLMPAESVKKSFISSLLKGEAENHLREKAQEFYQQNYRKLLRPHVEEFTANAHRKHTEGCLVSASLDIWVKPFADHLGLNLLCTEAAYKNGKFTGDFATPNCNGEEKVRRIKAFLNGKKFDKIIAFGDTAGDRQMLAFADEAHYKYFH